jgi:hypothetical protein
MLGRVLRFAYENGRLLQFKLHERLCPKGGSTENGKDLPARGIVFSPAQFMDMTLKRRRTEIRNGVPLRCQISLAMRLHTRTESRLRNLPRGVDASGSGMVSPLQGDIESPMPPTKYHCAQAEL